MTGGPLRRTSLIVGGRVRIVTGSPPPPSRVADWMIAMEIGTLGGELRETPSRLSLRMAATWALEALLVGFAAYGVAMGGGEAAAPASRGMPSV